MIQISGIDQNRNQRQQQKKNGEKGQFFFCFQKSSIVSSGNEHMALHGLADGEIQHSIVSADRLGHGFRGGGRGL